MHLWSFSNRRTRNVFMIWYDMIVKCGIVRAILPIEVLHCRNGDFRPFCSRDLDVDWMIFTNLTRITSIYSACAKVNIVRQGFRKLSYCRETERQRDSRFPSKYQAALRVVKDKHPAAARPSSVRGYCLAEQTADCSTPWTIERQTLLSSLYSNSWRVNSSGWWAPQPRATADIFCRKKDTRGTATTWFPRNWTTKAQLLLRWLRYVAHKLNFSLSSDGVSLFSALFLGNL